LTQVATIVLQAVATHRVGDRPDRVEPRQKKRRPKNDGYLDKPRQQARQERLRS
jgi:hypothetical protein